MGVPDGERDLIFEKFYRSDHTRHVGGTGLGLTICRSIVEAHGGDIGLRPAGPGTEFWFSLPALQTSEVIG
jgi:two-component system sensor histidine kinase KdpD